MKPPFQPGDLVRYKEYYYSKTVMKVERCCLGKDYAGAHVTLDDAWVVIYADGKGYDRADSIIPITKLERALK